MNSGSSASGMVQRRHCHRALPGYDRPENSQLSRVRAGAFAEDLEQCFDTSRAHELGYQEDDHWPQKFHYSADTYRELGQDFVLCLATLMLWMQILDSNWAGQWDRKEEMQKQPLHSQRWEP